MNEHFIKETRLCRMPASTRCGAPCQEADFVRVSAVHAGMGKAGERGRRRNTVRSSHEVACERHLMERSVQPFRVQFSLGIERSGRIARSAQGNLRNLLRSDTRTRVVEHEFQGAVA